MLFMEWGKLAEKDQLTNQTGNGIVVIASSTGGPAALLSFLPEFPATFSWPIVIVQHILPGFTGKLAATLNEKCNLPVSRAQNGEEVLPGHIYFAPAEKHLKIRRVPAAHHLFELTDEDKRCGVKPCADYLLESLAKSSYSAVAVVVLTGMGEDATEGILHLSEKKPIKVLLQDEESSVVYGMPGNVLKHYPKAMTLSLDKMVGMIQYYLSNSK